MLQAFFFLRGGFNEEQAIDVPSMAAYLDLALVTEPADRMRWTMLIRVADVTYRRARIESKSTK